MLKDNDELIPVLVCSWHQKAVFGYTRRNYNDTIHMGIDIKNCRELERLGEASFYELIKLGPDKRSRVGPPFDSRQFQFEELRSVYKLRPEVATAWMAAVCAT
jgi:hypothetical protein